MPNLSIRWSEHEGKKPYARPFGVTFLSDESVSLGGIAVSGAELLYYSQFQTAVLALAGEIFRHHEVEKTSDPQRAWLDYLATMIPLLEAIRLTPHSTFDDREGRTFRFSLTQTDDVATAEFNAPTLFHYQEFQAAIAHQTGKLWRSPEVEAVDDSKKQQQRWHDVLAKNLARPSDQEALAAAWPWR